MNKIFPKVIILGIMAIAVGVGLVGYLNYQKSAPKRFAASVVDRIISGKRFELYNSLSQTTRDKTTEGDFDASISEILVTNNSTKRYSSTQVIDATTPVKQKVYRVSYVVVDPSLSAYQVDVFAVKDKGAWKIDDLLYTKGEIQ